MSLSFHYNPFTIITPTLNKLQIVIIKRFIKRARQFLLNYFYIIFSNFRNKKVNNNCIEQQMVTQIKKINQKVLNKNHILIIKLTKINIISVCVKLNNNRCGYLL